MVKQKTYELSDGVTQSILSRFVDCRESARLFIDHWMSLLGGKEALDFGSIWHRLLEIGYTNIIEHQKTGVPVSTNMFQDTFNQAADMVLGHDGVCSPTRLGKPQDIEVYLAMAEALWEPYWKFWWKDFDKEWVAAEMEFDVLWQGYRLRGKIDDIFRLRNKLWILETKTPGQFNEDDVSMSLAFNFQNLFYILGAKLTGLAPISGVLYNLCRRPQLRQGKGERLQDFAQRLREDVIARTSTKESFYFKRFEVVYSERRLIKFEEELKAKLDEFKAWIDGKLPTYPNEQACMKKWNCEFLPACANDSMSGFTQNRQLFIELEGG